jgi:hypothetical protein
LGDSEVRCRNFEQMQLTSGEGYARLDFQIKKLHVIHTYRYREVLNGCGNLLQFFDDGLFPV